MRIIFIILCYVPYSTTFHWKFSRSSQKLEPIWKKWVHIRVQRPQYTLKSISHAVPKFFCWPLLNRIWLTLSAQTCIQGSQRSQSFVIKGNKIEKKQRCLGDSFWHKTIFVSFQSYLITNDWVSLWVFTCTIFEFSIVFAKVVSCYFLYLFPETYLSHFSWHIIIINNVALFFYSLFG